MKQMFNLRDRHKHIFRAKIQLKINSKNENNFAMNTIDQNLSHGLYAF
jgi:hypothetical protein